MIYYQQIANTFSIKRGGLIIIFSLFNQRVRGRLRPVGIIQKNKDWNFSRASPPKKTYPLPVGIIQKNKDWNIFQLSPQASDLWPVGIIQKNKDWNFSLLDLVKIEVTAGRHYPKEQGLKLHLRLIQWASIPSWPVGIIQKNKDWNTACRLNYRRQKRAGRHYPKEQGLKLGLFYRLLVLFLAGRHYPKEQGLKLLLPPCLST